MKNLINKVIKLTECIANNKSTEDIHFSKQEFQMFDDLKDGFECLVCYPEDGKDPKDIYNVDEDIANKIIKQNEILQYIYLKNSDHYLELMQKNVKLREALKQGNTYIDFPTEPYSQNFLLTYRTFEQKNDFLYQYLKVATNENVVRERISPLKPGLEVKSAYPIEIKGEEREQVVNSTTNTQNEDGSYRVQPKYISFSRLKKKAYANYVDVDGVLVLKSFYNTGYYKRLLTARKYQTKFTIVNPDGTIADNNKIDTCKMLKGIRNITAHNKIFSYKLTGEDDVMLDGKIFVLGNGQAVIVPICLFHTFAHINKLSNKQFDTLSYVYTPRYDKILTIDNCEAYLNACKEVRVYTTNNLNRLEVDTLFDYWIDKYNQLFSKNTEIDNLLPKNSITLEDFLNDKIKRTFPSITIDVLPLENIQLLLKKFVSVLDSLRNDPRDTTGKEQKEYIRFLLNDFYGFGLTSKYSVGANGRSEEISIEPRALLTVMGEIRDFVKQISNGKYTKPTKSCKYKDELYITLCAFVIYTNLIYNNLDDDIDPRTSQLPREERLKLDYIIDNIDMRNFRMVKKKVKDSGRETMPEDVEDKKEVISSVRNTIAHFGLKVKFSKTGNPEDNMLIFKYEGTPHKVNKISCKNFLQIIQQSFFAEYRPYNYNLIEVDDYAELPAKVIEKLN